MNTPKISTEIREQLIKEIAIILTKAIANDPSQSNGGVYGVFKYNPVVLAEMITDGKSRLEIIEFLTKECSYDKPENSFNPTPGIIERYL